jgi:predicted alpha/beta-fold hydrolase
MQTFKVICIDSDNRPKRISPYEWLVTGQVYTVVEVARMSLQQNRFGYRLKEVQLSDQSFPYEYYSADRFAPYVTLEAIEAEHFQEADLETV